VEQVVAFSIAAFLIVSGYFIGVATGKDQRTVSWRVVFARIVYLAVPYLIWSAVSLALKFAEGQNLTLDRLFLAILIGQTNEVYYFIPLLIQFYLLAPLLVRWEKANWKSLLLATGLIQLFVSLIQYPILLGYDTSLWIALNKLFPKWLFISHVFWFSLGIILAAHLTDFKRIFYPLRWWLLGSAAALIMIGFIEWEQYVRISGEEWLSTRLTIIDHLYTLVFIIGVLAFDKGRFPFFDLFSRLGPKSFGIYLVHVLVVEYSARLIYRFLPGLLAYQIVLQPTLIILGLGVPLLMMAAVDRSRFQRFSTYLFG
jgi:peptidoglycan/LPS O-acetylase OafA/YrhL